MISNTKREHPQVKGKKDKGMLNTMPYWQENIVYEFQFQNTVVIFQVKFSYAKKESIFLLSITNSP